MKHASILKILFCLDYIKHLSKDSLDYKDVSGKKTV